MRVATKDMLPHYAAAPHQGALQRLDPPPWIRTVENAYIRSPGERIAKCFTSDFLESLWSHVEVFSHAVGYRRHYCMSGCQVYVAVRQSETLSGPGLYLRRACAVSQSKYRIWAWGTVLVTDSFVRVL